MDNITHVISCTGYPHEKVEPFYFNLSIANPFTVHTT